METARDALPAGDLPGRLTAVSRTFRQWSLDHPREFALLFGSPIEGFARPHEDGQPAGGPAEEAGQRFGGVFGALIAQLYLTRSFPVPADDAIEPELRGQLREWCTAFPVELPLGVMQVFLSCWIRLYGIVALEVFGHLHFALSDPEPMFEAELTQVATHLGI